MPRRLLLFLLVIITGSAVIAQQPSANSKAELERRRQAILQSIKESQDELAITKKDKNATMAQLRALQAKLDARLSLIGNINQEISSIAGTIQSSSQEVGSLKQSRDALKLRYAQSLRYAYANRSSSGMLAFLFSARDYNDAVQRSKYLKRYRDFRKQQAEEIRTTQLRIEGKIDELSVQKSQKDMLLTAQEQQRQALQQETAEKGHVVQELKGREKELLVSIDKNKKAQRQVERAVASLIQREIEEQRRKAAAEAKKREEEERRLAAANAARNNTAANNNGGRMTSSSAGTNRIPSNAGPANTNNGIAATLPTKHTRTPSAPRDLSMTPEAAALSNSFAANRGRLPWPVDRGSIINGFGQHKHPVADVMIDNMGIDIQASPGAAVRAVFDGTVSSVFPIPGAGVCVMITHGSYYTVYTNMTSASVTKGQVVHTKQAIGTVGTNDEGQPMINFQVWKSSGTSSSRMNPAGWIAPIN